jgi:hypothetical protein
MKDEISGCNHTKVWSQSENLEDVNFIIHYLDKTKISI